MGRPLATRDFLSLAYMFGAAARHSPTCLRRGRMERRSNARRPVLSVRISSSPPAHRRRASPANQLRLGTSLTPPLYAGLGENRSMDLIDLLLGRPLATRSEEHTS